MPGLNPEQSRIFRQYAPDLARRAIQAKLAHQPAPEVIHKLNLAAGIFVTLHNKNGDLRGCIGHIEPTSNEAMEEIVTVAPLAALSDPRFAALSLSELDRVAIEVSLLTRPVVCDDRSVLDPKTLGIIVSTLSPVPRKGLLLPDIEGVNTASQQLEIALNKAGIAAHESYTLEVFKVEKACE